MRTLVPWEEERRKALWPSHWSWAEGAALGVGVGTGVRAGIGVRVGAGVSVGVGVGTAQDVASRPAASAQRVTRTAILQPVPFISSPPMENPSIALIMPRPWKSESVV